MQTDRDVGARESGPGAGACTTRVGQPFPSTSTVSAVPRICRRRADSRENTVTRWPPTSRVSAVTEPTSLTPTASGEPNHTASVDGITPSLPQLTHRSVMIDGRPANGVAVVTYVATSSVDSTAAWFAPQAPRRPPAKSARSGAPPKPQVSGTRTCTPA